jgi:hypothetical protein
MICINPSLNSIHRTQNLHIQKFYNALYSTLFVLTWLSINNKILIWAFKFLFFSYSTYLLKYLILFTSLLPAFFPSHAFKSSRISDSLLMVEASLSSDKFPASISFSHLPGPTGWDNLLNVIGYSCYPECDSSSRDLYILGPACSHGWRYKYFR